MFCLQCVPPEDDVVNLFCNQAPQCRSTVVGSAGRKTTPAIAFAHTHVIAHVKLGAEIDERGARARRACGPVRQLVALETPDADGRGYETGEGGGEEDPRVHEVAGHFVARKHCKSEEWRFSENRKHHT